jgi:hypothetical protein
MEEIEKQFDETIEPIMAQMEAGVWFKNPQKHCTFMCSYYNKKTMRCEAEIPTSNPDRFIDLTQALEMPLFPQVEAGVKKTYN